MLRFIHTDFLRAIQIIVLGILGFNSFGQKPELVIPTGNTGVIEKIKFSPKEDYIISSFGSNEAILWDAVTANIIEKYFVQGFVLDIGFVPGSPTVVASTTKGDIYSWTYLGKEHSRRFKAHDSEIVAIGFINNFLITSSRDETIKFWDISSYEKKIEITDYPDTYRTIQVDEQNGMVVFGAESGNILIYNFNTTEVEYHGAITNNSITGIVWSSDRKNIYVGNNLGIVSRLGLEPVSVLDSFKIFSSRLFSLANLGDSLFAATGRDKGSNFKIFNYKGKEKDLGYKENISHPGFIFGLQDLAVAKNKIILPEYDGALSILDIKKKRIVRHLNGESGSVNGFDVLDPSHIVYATTDVTGIVDFVSSDLIYDFYNQNNLQVQAVSEDLILTIGADSLVKVWNVNRANIRNQFRVDGEALKGKVRMLPAENAIVYRTDEKSWTKYNLSTGKKTRIKVKDCYDFIVKPVLVAYSERTHFIVFNEDLKPLLKVETGNVISYDVSPDSRYIATLKRQGAELVMELYNLRNGNKIRAINFPDSIRATQLRFGINSDIIFTYNRSVQKNTSDFDYNIRIWDVEKQLLKGTLSGHTGPVTDVKVLADNNKVFSSSMDGTIRIWDINLQKEEAKVMPMKYGNWVVLDSKGRFDASPGAMKKMEFRFRNHSIHLDQFKQNFYEPKLLQKVLGIIEEPYFTGQVENTFTLFPEINLRLEKGEEPSLNIDLEDQGGGVGRISLKLNDKEIVSDARFLSSFNPATNSLNYNVFTHPFIHPGKLNRLSVEAYNKEGYSVYNTRSFAFFSDKKAEDVLPDLHVVVIGVSDYKGKALDLTYAAKDAADFSVALKLASEKYLGYRNTFIHTLITSDTSKRTHPSKENIKKAFSDVARQARPNDVVVIYMAGHGLNSDIDNDFHFLTDDAEHPYISSAEELAKITISTTELSRILQSIPAYQQLLILDACHSGSLATGLFSSAGQLDSESIRALEEVKDRTGVYVLASSEKEDYSYESHAFEQGLLTYSLLFGIKGAGLLDGEYVDVVKLLQFVHKNVPDLAGDIGEHQQPVLRIPNNANSFFLGRMLTEEREKINLVAPKPIITPSNFQSEASMFDDLAFSSLMDETIRKKKEEGNHFLFLESGSQFQNALSVYGRYSVGNNGVILCKYKIFKNQKEIYRGEISSSDKRAVAASIAQELMKKL